MVNPVIQWDTDAPWTCFSYAATNLSLQAICAILALKLFSNQLEGTPANFSHDKDSL